MCQIFFDPEPTLSNGAFRALLSFAVPVCLHIQWETIWKMAPSPSPLHEHFQKPAPPLGCNMWHSFGVYVVTMTF